MNGYTHMVVGGLTSGLAVTASIAARKWGFEVNEHEIYPMLFPIPALIGALAPDMDMPNSTAGRFVRRALAVTILGTGGILLALGALTISSGGVVNTLIPLALFFAVCCALMVFVTAAKHRRETHCGLITLALLLPLAYLVFFCPVNILVNCLASCWAGFWMGWFSHLIADMFNRKGVPWLYPFCGEKRGKDMHYKHYYICTVVTGSPGETTFTIVSVVVFVGAYMGILLLGRML